VSTHGERESERVERVSRICAHILVQTQKRQYLNASHAASELVTALLEAFSAVLHPESTCSCAPGTVRSHCAVHGLRAPLHPQPEPPAGERGVAPAIVYRATVEAVSSVDVRLNVAPAADGERPIEECGSGIAVNIPGAANAEDVGGVQRAFGALIGTRGAVRITIEPDEDGAPKASVRP
jgi:hypothetical protein